MQPPPVSRRRQGHTSHLPSQNGLSGANTTTMNLDEVAMVRPQFRFRWHLAPTASDTHDGRTGANSPRRASPDSRMSAPVTVARPCTPPAGAANKLSLAALISKGQKAIHLSPSGPGYAAMPGLQVASQVVFHGTPKTCMHPRRPSGIPDPGEQSTPAVCWPEEHVRKRS